MDEGTAAIKPAGSLLDASPGPHLRPTSSSSSSSTLLKPNAVKRLVHKIRDKSRAHPEFGEVEEWVVVQDEAEVQHEIDIGKALLDGSTDKKLDLGGTFSSALSVEKQKDSQHLSDSIAKDVLNPLPPTIDLGSIPTNELNSGLFPKPPRRSLSLQLGASISNVTPPKSDHVVLPPAVPIVLNDRPIPFRTLTDPSVEGSKHVSGSFVPGDVIVPESLRNGVFMLKVSAKKVQQTLFKLDGDKGTIEWQSKKGGMIHIESIRELRLTNSARSFIDQFSYMSGLSPSHASRWITIIYTSTTSTPTKLLPSSPTASSGPTIGLPKWKALHMVALDSKSFSDWSKTIQALWDARRELMGGIGGLVGGVGDGDLIEEKRKAIWMRKQWREAEVAGEVRRKGKEDKNGWLDFEAVLRVCRRLNIASSRKDLYTRFQQADVERAGHLDFAAFQRFVKKLKERKDIEALYDSIKGESGLDELGFKQFLRDEQKIVFSAAELLKLFIRYAAEVPLEAHASDPSPSSRYRILLDGFTSFLLSSENNVMSDSSSKVTHDMTRPLPEYFVSSSHNTYLLGSQLVGDSTVEGYIRALLQGCRSVELDCWDGDGEPVIYHGRTFTGKVPVRDVVHAIGKYAFVASPYPIIISAEIHCCVEQQEGLVRILKEILGIRFLDAPLADREGHEEVLPSPEDLKYRILLKAKISIPNEKETTSMIEAFSSTETDSNSTSSESGFVGGGFRKASALVSGVKRHVALGPRRQSSLNADLPSPPTTLIRPSSFSSSFSSADRSSLQTAPGSKVPKPKFSPALAQVLIYTLGVKYRGFNKKESYSPSHMVSLSERTANKVLKQSLVDVVKHNRTHLMRLYPSVTRLGSSNYEPIRYWAAGAQLVSLNWQSTDIAYMLNGAMFSRNGRSGYVLKPPPLRIKSKDDQNKIEKHVLRVKVISAQQLPSLGDPDKHPSVDPFVEVTVFYPDILPTSTSPPALLGPSQSTPPTKAQVRLSKPSFKARTKTVDDNGFNPMWGENLTLPFRCAQDMLDLVFVKFDVRREGTVVDSMDQSIGSYCVSLGSMNQGYRHVPLLDKQLNQFLFASLFVHLSLNSA